MGLKAGLVRPFGRYSGRYYGRISNKIVVPDGTLLDCTDPAVFGSLAESDPASIFMILLFGCTGPPADFFISLLAGRYQERPANNHWNSLGCLRPAL